MPADAANSSENGVLRAERKCYLVNMQSAGYEDRRARPRTAVAVELRQNAPEHHFMVL